MIIIVIIITCSTICVLLLLYPSNDGTLNPSGAETCWDLRYLVAKAQSLLQVALDVGAHHLDERISELLFFG